MPLRWPTITASIRWAVACTRFGGEFVQVFQAAQAAEVNRVFALDAKGAVFLVVILIRECLKLWPAADVSQCDRTLRHGHPPNHAYG